MRFATLSALVVLAMPALASAGIRGGTPMPGGDQVLPFGIERIGTLDNPTASIDGVDERVDVDVAVIDTGIWKRHEDLNIAGGVNVSGEGSRQAWGDVHGHGTHIAGTIGALDNDLGVVGVAPGARVWAVKAGQGTKDLRAGRLTRGLKWATKRADVLEVVNISSYGRYDKVFPRGGTRDSALREAVKEATAAGLTIVVCAGNDSNSTNEYAFGSYRRVITVSAFTDTDGRPGGDGPKTLGLKDDRFAVFSNYDSAVDVAAPGVSVVSTLPRNQYLRGAGTSFSAPHVAGVAALFRATHPDASPAETFDAVLDAREFGTFTGDPDEFDEGVIAADLLP